MKNLSATIVLFVFIGCKQKNPKTVFENQTDSVEREISISPTTTSKPLNSDSFLFKPFDLYEFKKVKKGANSGAGGQKDYYFKPSYKGIYYHFFIFGSNGRCYIEKDTLFREDGLNIITYKPLGKYQNDYLDPDEELIYLEAHCNDFDLHELAFIGLDTIEIKKRLGNFTFKKENCAVYSYKKKALILGLLHSKIKWLKYIYMSEPLTPEKSLKEIYILK